MHGVYAATALGHEPHRDLRAAWLALDPTRSAEDRLASTHTTAVVSHASAAGLHQLGDLLDDVHEFTLAERKQTRREGVRLHRGELTAQEVTLIAGLPTTTPARTVADLLRDGHDVDHVATIVGAAVRRGTTSVELLGEALDPLAKRHGAADGRALAARLLDAAGLSPRAALRQLTDSGLGQALVAAGQASAIGSLLGSTAVSPLRDVDLAAVMPQVDLSTVVNIQPLLNGVLASYSEAVSQVVQAAGLDRLTGVVALPDMQALMAGALPNMQALMGGVLSTAHTEALDAVVAAADSSTDTDETGR